MKERPRLWSFISDWTSARHILCRPLPLSACRVQKPHLLTRRGFADPEQGSVFMLAVPYTVASDATAPERNLSLYAVPRDYHLFFKELEDELLPVLQQYFPTATCAVFADHSPIDEVDAAVRAGLGDAGRNGLLLTPEYGSFVFIGELITDVPYQDISNGEVDLPSPMSGTLCNGCNRCLNACPAGCRHDRDGCLSALTQKKGTLSPSEQARLSAHSLIWGCDTCQLVCPVNRRVLDSGADTPIPFFREQRLICLTADQLNTMSDEDFATRAFAWRQRETVMRNLSIKRQSEGETMP